MKNYHKLIFGSLVFIFLAITLLNYLSHVGKNHVAVDSVVKESQNEKKRFWDYYHNATDLRVDKQFAEAAEFYQKSLQLNPNHEDALYYLGNVQMHLGLYEKARRSWNRLIIQNELSSRGHSQLGLLYFCTDQENKLFNIDRSEHHFKKAAELNREETGPQRNLGKIFLINKNHSVARDYLYDITSTNFMDGQAFFLLGYIAWLEGRQSEADSMFNRSLTIFEGDDKTTVAGEGATKDGISPMVVENGRCDFIGTTIHELLSEQPSAQQHTISNRLYQEFNQKLIDLRKAIKENE